MAELIFYIIFFLLLAAGACTGVPTGTSVKRGSRDYWMGLTPKEKMVFDFPSAPSRSY